MKKYLFILLAAMVLASCTTTTKTARTESVPYAMYNATVADLDVAPQRIKHTIVPTNEIRKAGLANCKEACIQEALEKNGNADLLVEPEFVYSMKRTLFGKKVISVTVTGRPAKYKNFRSLPDNVWTNEVFRDKEKKPSMISIMPKFGFFRSIFRK
jgi:hypothetical protein